MTTTTVPPVNRRQIMRQRTQEEILELAVAQVRAGGPLALSLRGIAKSLGFTAPALYRYWPSLDALMSAVVDRFDAELVEAAADRAVDRGEAGDVALAAVLADWAATRPGEWSLLLAHPQSAGARVVERALRAYGGVPC